jgi:oligopeptidase A
MKHHLPNFSTINPDTLQASIEAQLEKNKQLVEALLEANDQYHWDNLILPLSMAENELDTLWSPISHKSYVMDTEALRNARNACLPLLSEYHSEMGQHQGLFKAVKSLQTAQDALQLDDTQKKVLDNALKDFHLSGIALSHDKQQRFRDINKKLSKLQSAFADNVLDATTAWTKQVTKAQLAGLPASALAICKQAAIQREREGYVLTLEFPSFKAVTTYADDRALRQEVYRAFVTRAAGNSNAPEMNNNEAMVEILQLRQEKAQLLGFNDFSALSLDKKMAETGDDVIDFLNQLATKALPFAQQEQQQLSDFAQTHYAIQDIEAWDTAYMSEKLKVSLFDLSAEALKAYFPVEKVISGLFDLVEALYGIHIKQKQGVDTWHPDVRFYEIFDADNVLQAQFYFDLYSRQHKRGGAWMGSYCSRYQHKDERQIPVAYMTCNSAPTSDKIPALLSHDEVITLFHEFGHGLHHMLTEVDYLEVSGISGVEWDAVELPSQFMENWCWQRETLDKISEHYQTGATLPDDLLQKMQTAKHFQSGMAMVRQLEFSLFDMNIHQDTSIHSATQIQTVLNEVRKQVEVVKAADFNRFQNSFTHIFAGGYAAGYYSYKWAEVLSADAFARFEEEGLFNAQVSTDFLQEILSRGGSRSAMASFIAFRGRKPSIDALLRHSGLSDETS